MQAAAKRTEIPKQVSIPTKTLTNSKNRNTNSSESPKRKAMVQAWEQNNGQYLAFARLRGLRAVRNASRNKTDGNPKASELSDQNQCEFKAP
jgi:hypothetical protein